MPHYKLNFLVLLHLLLLSACMGKEPPKHRSSLLQTEGIHAAFYNSTGTRIAMATTKGRLLLCDQNLKILKAVQAHQGVANSSFFSLSDKYIITGGSDRKIRQWAARNLLLVHTFPYTFNSHTTVLGNQTMVGCGEYGKVLIYHRLSKKTSQLRLSNTAAYHVYYNQKDTSVVVSAGRAAFEVDILNNRVSRKYDSKQALVYCVMPDQTNTRVVLGCADSTIKIFDRNTKQLIFTSKKLDGQVYVACYNYQNNTIAASTSTGSIYFFDTKLRSLQKRIKAFNGCINTIHYHPSDAYIVAGSLDKQHGGAKLYSTKTYRLIKQLN